MLELKHTDIGYADGEPLILDATGDLRTGELIALAGENGSGKSTLLRCCSGLFQPEKGRILVNNQDITTISRQKLARTVSLVTTANYFYENLTVEEVVSLGRHPYTNWWGRLGQKDRLVVEEAIEFVGLRAFSQVNLARLSDGERQRAMIARAFAQDTQILLLDEPMAFLDQPNRASIAGVLKDLRQAGKSLIYSTHEVDSVFRVADKCWLIHQRQLVQGSPEDLALQDVFHHLYSESGLIFNEEELRFTMETDRPAGIVIKISDPRKSLWTRRALEKIDFGSTKTLLKTGQSMVIEDAESVDGWKLHLMQNTFEFTSLYDMVAYLTDSG